MSSWLVDKIDGRAGAVKRNPYAGKSSTETANGLPPELPPN